MSGIAANYASAQQLNQLFRPEIMIATIKQQRFCMALSPKLASSKMVTTDEALGASEVKYAFIPRKNRSSQSCGTVIDGCNYANAETNVQRLRATTASVQICNHEREMLKFDRLELALLTKNRTMLNDMVKEQIRRDIVDLTDSSNLHTPIGQASPYNHGPNAGLISHNINLGDATTPGAAIAVNTPGSGKARLVIARLQQTLAEAGIDCDSDTGTDDIVYYCSPGFYAYLLEDYRSPLIAGSSNADTTVTGMLRNTYGHPIFRTTRMPCTKDSAGKRLEYVVAVAKNDFATPFKMQYSEWDSLNHDVFYPYAYSFDSWLFDPDSAAYAVIDLTPL
jgi:hypothetical protein